MQDKLYDKQIQIFNPERDLPEIHILGIGTIGSWTTLALAKLGFSKLHIYDFDSVEKHNIANQFYKKENENFPKTESLVKSIEEFAYIDKIKLEKVKFDEKNIKLLDKTIKKDDIVIMAFDNLEIRKLVFEHIRKMPITIIDGRMGGEIMRIFTLKDVEKEKNEYMKTLDMKAIETTCGGSSINYNGMIIGGLISSFCKKVVNGETIPYDVAFDIKSLSLVG